ncbi:MAG: hypothetical protein ACXVCH_11045 [Bdellovibrionota bacterium]
MVARGFSKALIALAIVLLGGLGTYLAMNKDSTREPASMTPSSSEAR